MTFYDSNKDHKGHNDLAEFGNFDGAPPEENEDYDFLIIDESVVGPYERKVNEDIDDSHEASDIFKLLGLPVQDYEDFVY